MRVIAVYDECRSGAADVHFYAADRYDFTGGLRLPGISTADGCGELGGLSISSDTQDGHRNSLTSAEVFRR